MNTPVVITINNLPAGVVKLLAALVPPADADLRAELEHQKRLNAALCDRVHAQAEMLARRAETAAEAPPAFPPLPPPEAIPEPTDAGTPAAEVFAPLVAAAEEVKRTSSNGKPSADLTGKGKGARQAEIGRQNRLAIALALANGPLSIKEMTAATGVLYGTVSGIIASVNGAPPWFAKTEDRHGAPYQLTDAGRAALAEAGYVLVSGAEAAQPAEPVPETVPAEIPPAAPAADDDDAPVSVQELSRRQALTIAKAIFDAPTPEISRAQIEAATGLSESVVKQRLMAGSNGLGLPATRYFAKRNDGWGLTYVGVSLVKERA